MVKRLNAHIPDEIHRALRIALAEDETDFSTWVRERIADYLAKRGKVPAPKPKKRGKGK